MRRFVAIGAVALLALAPIAAAKPRGKIDVLNVPTEISSIGETAIVNGTLHLNVVDNANGRTLHVNLSNGEAVGETSGSRYKLVGAQQIPIPIDVDNVPAKFVATLGRTETPIEFNLVLTFDSAGEIQSARLVSVTEGR